MNIGKLDQRLTIQTFTESQTTSGEATLSWSTLATVWGSLHPLKGEEYFSAQKFEAAVTARIRIRYRADITPKMRVLHGSTVYEIVSVVDAESRGFVTELMVFRRD